VKLCVFSQDLGWFVDPLHDPDDLTIFQAADQNVGQYA
jgi:hypothetical protein